jgi:mRNA-degrading endonuclease RelE of RelBE toxin-antitoxin system
LPYRIEYAPETEEHFRHLTARQQAFVFDAVAQQLAYESTVETRNRKRLRPHPLASWELRVGNLRVYYDVEDDPEPLVKIMAVGIKRGNRVYIGGELYPL